MLETSRDERSAEGGGNLREAVAKRPKPKPADTRSRNFWGGGPGVDRRGNSGGKSARWLLFDEMMAPACLSGLIVRAH